MLRFLPKKNIQPVLNTALPGFDEVYYRYWYRDVEGFGGGPLGHYLQIGWREGRDPSAGFGTNGYLLANPDVIASGHNPLVHFLNQGLSEGRKGWEKDPLAPPPRPLPPGHLKPQLLLSPPGV
jgi:hypothetical protein